MNCSSGDQGFLNSYYVDFANARLFDPNMAPEDRRAYTPKTERLSTLYNADVGLYVLANKVLASTVAQSLQACDLIIDQFIAG